MLPRRLVLAALATPALIRPARAEAQKLRVARQYGLGYAQLAMLEDQKLVEKHAAAAGLGQIEVTWNTFRSSDVMNDALLSGSIDIASLGIPGLGTIWDRTAGTRLEVRGISGLNWAPLPLVTREPSVRSIADFKPGMKIAVPAVKVSNQAIFLQIAAAKLWGKDQYNRLDSLTISMAHPDAVVAILSGKGEISSYFSSPPYAQRALRDPAVHEITNSTAILDSPASFNVLGCPVRWSEENPKLAAAFITAMEEATKTINADKAAAAASYARATNDKMPIEELTDVMRTGLTYTLDVQGTLPILQFMADIGTLKHRPKSWTDYMLPSAVAGRHGS